MKNRKVDKLSEDLLAQRSKKLILEDSSLDDIFQRAKLIKQMWSNSGNQNFMNIYQFQQSPKNQRSRSKSFKGKQKRKKQKRLIIRQIETEPDVKERKIPFHLIGSETDFNKILDRLSKYPINAKTGGKKLPLISRSKVQNRGNQKVLDILDNPFNRLQKIRYNILISKVKEEADDSTLWELFMFFDRNKDGLITYDEFKSTVFFMEDKNIIEVQELLDFLKIGEKTVLNFNKFKDIMNKN